MKQKIVYALSVVAAIFVACGCASSPPPATGFLSDYTKHEEQ